MGIWIIIFSFLYAPPFAHSVSKTPAQVKTRPCTSADKQYFKCILGNKKEIILCGSKNLKGADAWIQYQFGRPEKHELIYPAQRNGSISAFTWNSMPTAGGFRNQFAFTNAGVLYVLTIFSQDDQDSATLSVDGPKSVGLSCKGSYQADFGAFDEVFKCDQDSALGCPSVGKKFP